MERNLEDIIIENFIVIVNLVETTGKKIVHMRKQLDILVKTFRKKLELELLKDINNKNCDFY